MAGIKKVEQKDEEKKIRDEANKLLSEIHLSDKEEEEKLKKLFDNLENGELKQSLDNLKRMIEKDRARIGRL